MSTTTCTAEWIGSGAIGVSAALLVAAAARLGAHDAHNSADQALAAYRAERERLKAPPAPAPVPFDIPPLPANPPTLPAQDQTLQLHEVQAYRARHRKGHPRMQLIEDLYLKWQPLSHTVDCPRPIWDVVELRQDEGVRIVQTGAEHHTCDNDGCSHGNSFGRVQLRLLCHDCGTVQTITGEGLTQVCTHVSLTGWGQAPRQVAGVWLWPGQPAVPGGEPHDYLVTRERVESVTTESLYGIITRYRDAEGSPRWIAGVLQDANGEHYVHSLRWRHRSAGLIDLDTSAAWIASAETRAQRPLVVAV